VILDLRLAALVRVATGALFGVVGALILLVRPRTRRGILLGSALLAWMPSFVLQNLLDLSADPLRAIEAMNAASNLATGLLFAALAAWEARGPDGRAARWPVALTLAVAAALLAPLAFLDAGLAGETPWQLGLDFAATIANDANIAASVVVVFALVARVRARRQAGDTTGARRAAWLAAALAVLPTAYGSGPYVFDGSTPYVVYGQLAQGALAIALFALAWPRTRLVGVVVLGTMAIGFTTNFLPFDVALFGVARVVELAILAYAILGPPDLLHAELKVRTVRRSTLAATFLAVLLIVAQVAQNFLAAQYGLLMGGIVAGGFVVAAQPIQRAFERAAQERAPVERRAPGAPGGVEAYRRALQLALHDGPMTAAEEEHLAHLAEALAIGHVEAMRLRREVEAEYARP
jgi:hypothetical protein